MANYTKGGVFKKWTEEEEQYLMDTIRDNPDNLSNEGLIMKQLVLKLGRTLSSIRQRYVIILNRNNPDKKKPEKRAYNKKAIEERHNNLPAVLSQHHNHNKAKHPIPVNDIEAMRMQTAMGLITKLDTKEKQQLLNYLLNL